MKCIAIVDSDRYIMEVNHTELEKFFDLYYNKMGHLKVGQEVNLGEGYDHARKTGEALGQIKQFLEKSGDVVDTLRKTMRLKIVVNTPASEPSKK